MPRHSVAELLAGGPVSAPFSRRAASQRLWLHLLQSSSVITCGLQPSPCRRRSRNPRTARRIRKPRCGSLSRRIRRRYKSSGSPLRLEIRRRVSALEAAGGTRADSRRVGGPTFQRARYILTPFRSSDIAGRCRARFAGPRGRRFLGSRRRRAGCRASR